MTDPTPLWVDALQRAYSLAHGERLQGMRGQHVKRFDAMGLHPESEAWGQIHAAENLEPVLAAVGCAPESLRDIARRDAEAEFRHQVLEEAA